VPNRIQQIEPVMKTKLIDNNTNINPDNHINPVVNPVVNPIVVNPVVNPNVNPNVNPVVKRITPSSTDGTSPVYQRKAPMTQMSPAIANKNIEAYKSPLPRQSSINHIENINNSNNNSNNNTPHMKNYKKINTPLPSIKNNNNNINNNNVHISDKYQKIKLYKEQLLDVISQLEKDEEKEIRLYNKNNPKMANHKDKSSLGSNVMTLNNNNNYNNNNNNMINSKLNKNYKDDNNDFDYNLNEADYEAILSDSKAFVKNNNKSHGIANFLKNFKSRQN